MEYILGLIILIMIFLGYRVMKKIDDFLELPTTFPKEKKYVDYGGVILVYGKSDFADGILNILEENGEPYVHINDVGIINFEESYICFLAVDSDDYKNLIMSRNIEIGSNINNQVLLCNDLLYQNIFYRNNVPFVYVNDGPEKMIMLAKQRIKVTKND